MKTQIVPPQLVMPSAKSNAKSNNDSVISRRRFMASATMTASVMAVPTSNAYAAIATSALNIAPSSSALLASDFRQHLATEFHAKSLSKVAASLISLRLADVAPCKTAHPSLSADVAAENVFSLKFTVLSGKPDETVQDTYWLIHPTLGEFALLMVPAQGGRALRAEFHRL
jgi:hypothetical protein